MGQTVETIIANKRPRRRVQGIAAALLPYEENGGIAVEAFQQHLVATRESGLLNAVNMDTGYVNYLTRAEKRNVLRWTRAALGQDVSFVAGAFIEHETGTDTELYRRQMDAIASVGGVPILFQTARLQGKSSAEKARVYQEASRDHPQVLAFELSPRFAANGEMFDDDLFKRILDIPAIVGMKHSSLDRR